MDKTAFETLVQQRAVKKLQADLITAAENEQKLCYQFQEAEIDCRIKAQWYYYSMHSSSGTFRMQNEFTENIFNKMLPVYIQRETEFILQCVDNFSLPDSEKENF